MLSHKGYLGRAEVDFEDGMITGEVIGTRDVISFGGATVEEAAQSFRDAVDGYLAFCAEQGRKPQKPYSGKLVVRMTPEQHQAVAADAELAGISLNALIVQRITAGQSLEELAALGRQTHKDMHHEASHYRLDKSTSPLPMHVDLLSMPPAPAEVSNRHGRPGRAIELD